MQASTETEVVQAFRPASARHVTLTALAGLPMVNPGDDLAALLAGALRCAGIVPADDDVLVVAQKVVSKAEGRFVDLASVVPGACATKLAAEVCKDPRLVEVILSQSSEVVRHRKDVLVVAHRLGFVMANAGVDQSNVAPEGEHVLLLPEDPDASARSIKMRLDDEFGVTLGVVINDSFGRPWRQAWSAWRWAPRACRRSETSSAPPICSGGRCA